MKNNKSIHSIKRKAVSIFTALLIMLSFLSYPVFATTAETASVTVDELVNEYIISDMNVDVVVDEARVYHITETITVEYISEYMHGIYRSIPLEGDGESYWIENLELEGAEYTVDEYSTCIDIRIGDPCEYAQGTQTYIITYELHHYRDYLEDGDYIYLNVCGFDWDAPIEKFTASITYPEGAELEESIIHSGTYASVSNRLDVQWQHRGNTLTMQSLSFLYPYEGVTVNMRLTEGTFVDAPEFPFPFIINNVTANIILTEEKEYIVEQQFVFTVPESTGGYEYPDDTYVLLPLYPQNEGALLTSYEITVLGENLQHPTPEVLSGTTEKPGEDGFLQLIAHEPGVYTVTVKYTLLLRVDAPILYDFIGYTNSNARYSIYANDGNYEYSQYYNTYSHNNTGVAPIENMTITIKSHEVNLPKPEITFGRYGDPIAYTLNYTDTEITITTDKTLYPAEELVMYFDISNAVFVRKWSTNSTIVLAVAGGSVLLALILHSLFGKDSVITPVVEVYPPDGVNAPEAGYVLNSTVALQEVSSILYNWANAGYIKIKDENGSVTIEKIQEIEAYRPAYEQRLFTEMFMLGNHSKVTESQLQYKFHTNLKKAQGAIPKKFETGNTALREENKVLQIGLLVLGFLPILAITWFTCRLNQDAVYIITAVTSFVVYILHFKLWQGMREKSRGKNKNSSYILGGIASVLLVFIYLVNIFMWQGPYWFFPVALGWAVVISASIVAFTAVHIGKRTEYGTNLTGSLLGFKEFIRVAERDRLEMLVNEDPTYFYNVLPYAQIFGLTAIWIDKFKNISLPIPSWYETTTPLENMQTYVFLSRLNGAMQRTGNAAAELPSPSSFGGFSSGGGSSSGGSFGSFGGGSFGGSSGGGFSSSGGSSGGFGGGGSGGGGGRGW